MSEYIVTDSELSSISDAIKVKSGGSGSLVFPSGFLSEIQTIPNVDTLLASGTYTKTDSATKPLELKIPVSFTGTPTEAYIIVSEDVGSDTNRVLQCWGRLTTDKQVIQDNFPKWWQDQRLKLSLSLGKNTNNAEYLVNSGGVMFSGDNPIYIIGGTINSSYAFKDTTYNWYIWGTKT